jgi:hypothetical protein
LLRAGIADAGDPTHVAVVEKHGNYSGRRVTFFRAFAPGHQDAELASGHVEREGTVIINRLPEQHSVAPPRQPANRADHTDDQRLVFWDAEAARTSEVALSTPAATWLQARSTSEPHS